MVFGGKKMRRHKAREVSKFKNAKEEIENLEDTENEENSEGSNKKVIRLGRGPEGLKRNKIVPKRKVRSAIISKLDNDGMTNNVDTAMVPSNPVMNGKEPVDSVGDGMTTSDESDMADDVDTGTITSKQLKMSGKESNLVLRIQDKSKHLEEHKIGVASTEENMEEEVANEVRASFKKKVIDPSKRGNKKISLRGRNGVTGKNTEKPEASNKTRVKDKTKGMIFMCSSKTKKDCYDYKVLGLPRSKRDIVSKISEGMILFLFDYNLKLMYGIYKAAGPGGYNLEPEAFNSEFPSQVRFTILEECLPLAEEDFKEIIIDNYYSKNKFNCQLTSNQVKNLSERFKSVSKGSKSKRSHAEAQRPRRRWKGEKHTIVGRVHRSTRAETQISFYHGHRRHYGWQEDRHDPFGDHLYSEDAMVHGREVNAYPVAHLPSRQVLHLQPTSILRPSEIGTYGRDTLQYDDQHLLDMEFGPGEEFEHHSSYRRSRFRDEVEHHDYYRRSRYQNESVHRGPHRRHQDELAYHNFYKKTRKHQSGRDPSTSSGMPPKYYPPASRGPSSKFRFSAGLKRYHKPRQAFHRHWLWHQHQHNTWRSSFLE